MRSFIAYPAGIARMNRAKFHLYTTLGSWPWCFALAWIGMKLGKAWDTDPRLKATFHSAELVIVVVLVAGAGVLHLAPGPRAQEALSCSATARVRASRSPASRATIAS